MKITVNRTGGYAGITEQLGFMDTANADPKIVAEVTSILKKLEFFNLPSNIAGEEIGADLQRYEINISDENRQHTVNFSEGQNEQTTQLKTLVDIVQHGH